MFHAMRFAMFADDGSAPIPTVKLWFTARAPFSTSYSQASALLDPPYATYNGTRRALIGSSSTGYYFSDSGSGLVKVVADNVLTEVAFADPSRTQNIATQLISVDTIGSLVTSLGNYAFLDCGRLGPRFEPLYYGAGLSLGKSCFEGCYGIREFAPRFLSKVTSSGEAAFARCTSLTTINGMSAFDPRADRSFYRCTSLASLTGGYSSATSLGDQCFDGCRSLTSLSGLPSTLTSLGEYCFARCSSLADIMALGASSGLDALPDGCFYRCTSLTAPACGSGSNIEEFGISCFERCSSLTTLTGSPPGLVMAKRRCFAKTGLAALTGMPLRVELLGDECFAECEHLLTLSGLSSSVTSIGEGCFRDCYGEDHPVEDPPEKVSSEWGLADIDALAGFVDSFIEEPDEEGGGEGQQGEPVSVTIPARCFYGDRLIRGFPDMSDLDVSLKIGPYAFANCSGLDSLAGLPPKTTFKEGAFSGCFRAPHDWWVLDEEQNPPEIVKLARWCGLYDADMSGLETTSLPARCFENCGALAELPPLPPGLMKMGDRCFAGCSGMANLDSLADLTVEVTDGSTHYDGTDEHGPTYPSFGEWCFAGCGMKPGENDEYDLFFNDEENPPQIGHLSDVAGLKLLCDRLELEAASTMSASSSAILEELFGYLSGVAEDAMPGVVAYDAWRMFGGGGSLWPDTVTKRVVFAGMIASLSVAAAKGFTLFKSELVEHQDADHQSAQEGAMHTIIAFYMPYGENYQLWLCCPGVNAETVIPVTSSGTYTVRVAGGTQVNMAFTLSASGASAALSVSVERAGDEVIANTVVPAETFTAPVSATDVALSFLKFIAYVCAGMKARTYASGYADDQARLDTTLGLSDLESYVISNLTDGDAALAKLRDLNLVTPANGMLGAHCFDGCTFLTASSFPTLIADVPQHCFAGTAVSTLTPFKYVYSMGAGAFSGSAVATMTGFPFNVNFVAARLFQNCEDLATLAALPRRVKMFGSYAFAGCTTLNEVKCTVHDEWPTGNARDLHLCHELYRTLGATDTNSIPSVEPPLPAFVQARAVESFGASCFEGCEVLTGSALTIEQTASTLAEMIERVTEAVKNPDIFTCSSPSQYAMHFTAVFHLAVDLDFVVDFYDAGEQGNLDGPPALDWRGQQAQSGSTIAVTNLSWDDSGSTSFYTYNGAQSEGLKYARLSYDGNKYTPRQGYSRFVVSPARPLPSEWGGSSFAYAYLSEDGYITLLLETEGHRFAVELCFTVTRNWSDGYVDSATADLVGARVTDTEVIWPGYPEPEETARYSAVPLLTSIGDQCFEGCVALDSLDWIPLGVTRLPKRCFAGVPFHHRLEYTVVPPSYTGWSSPTLTAYKDAIARVLNFSEFYYEQGYSSGSLPPDFVLKTAYNDSSYIHFTLSYTESGGTLVPVLTLDSSHTATVSVDANETVDRPSDCSLPYGVSLGSTYGLAGSVEVVSVSGNTATLRLGDLTMLLTVSNSVTGSTSSVSLDYDLTYVSCPPYDAMKHALEELDNATHTYVNQKWTLSLSGDPLLELKFDEDTGVWKPVYKQFSIPVSADSDADEYEFDKWTGLTDDQRGVEESERHWWFKAEVPDDTGDAADKTYRPVYMYLTVEAKPVPVKSNSVTVPTWITEIGKDCFTFKGFEDAEDKLEALYINRSAYTIKHMDNYPWGVPDGCVIYSTTGGQVYPER